MVSATTTSRISVLAFVCGLAAVALAHAGYTFVVYRARALTHSAFASSDLLLFALPAVLAFCGYFFLLRARALHLVLCCIIAIVLLFLTFWLSMLVPINTYGT
jgi:hypothetical protein